MVPITYLRTGRKIRASGHIVARDNGLTKIKPMRDDWGHVWITAEEIAAGAEKPPYAPREKREVPEDKPKRVRKPKAAPVPAWALLVADVRMMEIDHHPEGWPAVKMRTLSDLANELEKAHRKLDEFLPLTTP